MERYNPEEEAAKLRSYEISNLLMSGDEKKVIRLVQSICDRKGLSIYAKWVVGRMESRYRKSSVTAEDIEKVALYLAREHFSAEDIVEAAKEKYKNGINKRKRG
ncbi:hypothetical protein A3A76_01860 [Candidatus Woesebacteria bacterium RIFCSPLOWO2_01_FULL_39_23]|uniref:Uncharacterized protein n=1 Tax=Candidatus Woesebacteria bacterium RIFCSPHIGHO2_01_FULL_40_22 TaxID=1802499 RepID=A0A1F7YGF3_9BACT|nr:MAG: hypothetical protein A2141_05290 [Candidatus Woesebacteria bacterium RBG_16_40_11]OGM26342.1 MAG: hypothetical protein A2628_03205 [Candidatus Woesebacteria bacterium RIFCSPHIGHO2_01_FULL_40_22]OGM37592.1 MAG: hypothetical protein A3E41_05180 [Candidatus Woesebacteria bacterium RIFCSPHIGHO2_12_FULL_38_9]OGM61885.1 MAG: hypothetical protein A3A76_01860 [Candidatus Woesebacteria bacterium RIFCSPLOWO2_01_FULL_39_23]